MPLIHLRVFSQRGRKITDPVSPGEFEIQGTHFVHPADLDPADGGLDLNLVPGQYKSTLRLEEFDACDFTLKADHAKTVSVQAQHRCTLLPAFAHLDEEQQRLFRSYADPASAASEWNVLSDNQACTFFQVTYALARTPLGDSFLSRAIQRVQRIGGALISARAEDGATRSATGWRLHVLVKAANRETIAGQLKASGFARDAGAPHPTHSRFGYMKSFRQQGAHPRLQMVFTPDFSGADVDLDQGSFHKSAPHHVYKAMKKKFPGVETLYRVR